MTGGIVFLVVSAVFLAVLVWADVHRLFRLTLALPLLSSTTGFFQARAKT